MHNYLLVIFKVAHWSAWDDGFMFDIQEEDMIVVW